jgi:hypothetical protein
MPEFCVVSEPEQAMQLPRHALLQQTPSAQKPDEHSPGRTQGSPFVFLAAQRLVVALQYEVVAQSLSVAQTVRQPSTTSQVEPPQSCGVAVVQAPFPSHVDVGVNVEALQDDVEQT